MAFAVVVVVLALVAGVVGAVLMPRRAPRSDADVTDRDVRPPAPRPGAGSPQGRGRPVPGSEADRNRHGQP